MYPEAIMADENGYLTIDLSVLRAGDAVFADMFAENRRDTCQAWIDEMWDHARSRRLQNEQ
jgi:hypothetical protein